MVELQYIASYHLFMTASSDDLSGLTFGLFLAGNTWRRMANQVLRKQGISDSTARALVVLSRQKDGVRQGSLADLLGIEGPTLIRLLDPLTRAELVERRDDPNDGRAKTLHLTRSGHRMVVTIEELLRDLRARTFANADPADIQACLKVFACLEDGKDIVVAGVERLS